MRRERRAFTMLEAMVALALIGLVCVGVLAAYAGALRTSVSAAEKLPLLELARDRLAALDLSPAPLDALPDSLARGAWTGSSPYAGTRWTVTATPLGRPDGLYDVRVTVVRGDADVSLRTRRYRPGAFPRSGPP